MSGTHLFCPCYWAGLIHAGLFIFGLATVMACIQKYNAGFSRFKTQMETERL